jgi:hypothetical protein
MKCDQSLIGRPAASRLPGCLYVGANLPAFGDGVRNAPGTSQSLGY